MLSSSCQGWLAFHLQRRNSSFRTRAGVEVHILSLKGRTWSRLPLCNLALRLIPPYPPRSRHLLRMSRGTLKTSVFSEFPRTVRPFSGAFCLGSNLPSLRGLLNPRGLRRQISNWAARAVDSLYQRLLCVVTAGLTSGGWLCTSSLLS